MALPPFSTVTSLPDAAAAAPPEFAAPLANADRPLVLLPVRLETRFSTRPDGSSELLIRIYPDAIHIDSHSPTLTPDEHEWGKHFWDQDWRSGADPSAVAAPWRQLVGRFGEHRGLWIAEALRPLNPADRPTAAAPADQQLPIEPRFPAVDVAADGNNTTWRSAARALLMPARWIAVLHSGGAPALVATGADIVSDPAVGPDPTTPPADVPADQLGVDFGMRWMVDFGAAEEIGMGIRVAVPSSLLAGGIEALYVLGARAAASADIGDLLAAHNYTDGLEYLSLGTPTNIDSTSAPFAETGALSPGGSTVGSAAVDPTDGNDAARLGAALGLAGAAPGAGLTAAHERAGRAMSTVLWEPTWGYFLSNLIGFDSGLSTEALELIRAHCLDHVRAAGPFASISAGPQPYGVLPTTSLDLWAPASGADDAVLLSWLRDLLARLRDQMWRPQLRDVARIGKTQPADPDADLADVMRADGVTGAYRNRSVLGRHYFEHLRAFLGEDLRADGFIPAEEAMAAAALPVLGLASTPRIGSGTYAELAWPIAAPLLGSDDPAFMDGLLTERSIAAITALAPTSLFQALLRHAWLREHAVAAAQLVANGDASQLAAHLRDAELVDLVDGAAPSPTWLRQLDAVAPATGGATVRQFLEGAQTFDLPALSSLGAFRSALADLRRLDVDALELLMSGTLDAASHRIDAWITSLASRRLAELRAAEPAGSYIGGYGWVENLAPAAAGPAATALPSGEDAPLALAADDSGFIHAPSLSHAEAAALLRNAHLGATGVPTADSPFAISVPSWGAREARRLLDGVRNGQPLGALLGYRFERGLHEASLDRYIAPVRRLAPLAANRLEQTDAPLEAIAANNVVDGLALQRIWHDNPGTITALLAAESASDAQQKLITEQLGLLDATVDALSDALTAESAYQAVRGNAARTASTLAAVARGDAPPPDLEVTRFPRSGTSLTHRIAAVLPGGAGPAPGWARGGSARAAAEPTLDSWAGLLLGDPQHCRCTVDVLDSAGAVTGTLTMPLSELGLSALDIVFGVPPENSAGLAGEPASGSELEDRVVNYLIHRPGGLQSGGSLRVQHARPADLQTAERTLFDVMALAVATQAMLARARGANGDDLAPPDSAVAPGLDVDELGQRASAAEGAFDAALASLAGACAQTPPDAATLRAALLGSAAFGLPHAVPSAADVDSGALLLRARSVLIASQARATASQLARGEAAPPDAIAQADHLVARLRAVFGGPFLAVPTFRCGPDQASQLTTAVAASHAVTTGPLEPQSWLAAMARIRPPISSLSQLLGTAEVLGTGGQLDLAVAQLPYAADERWIALIPPAGHELPHGKVAVVLIRPVPVDLTAPLAGVVIDDWIETVPSSTEQTAIAFQYDPPNAMAPQAILLAVPPVLGTPWTVGGVHRVLVETLDLAKLRAVPSAALGALGQYLPATFLGFNAAGDAVSTDLGPMLGRELI